jgi:uncharacterized protein
MRFVLLALTALLAACGSKQAYEVNTIEIRLPRGQVIHAETAIDQEQLARGLRFRDKLEPDHGMMQFWRGPGRYPYWMYQVGMPLDIVWMDSNRRIVEIVRNAPPCSGDPQKCPHYGGTRDALYVLQIAGGSAAKYGLEEGQTLDF